MAETPISELVFHVTRDDGRVFLVSMGNRVAAPALVAAIEWYWYAPGTPRNRFFDTWFVMWQEMAWYVCAFPIGRFAAVKSLARRLGLRIADGTPLLMQASGESWFPGARLPDGRSNRSMFTVENDTGSPIYRNSRRDNAAMLQASIEINTTLNRGVRLSAAQIADYIYGPGFPLERSDA